MINKYKKHINIGLDLVSIISLIVLNIYEYNRLNTLIVLGLIVIKTGLNFKDISKSYLSYIGIVTVMLGSISYVIMTNKDFQFNEYTVVTSVVIIGMFDIFLRNYKEGSSAVNYITILTVMFICFGYTSTYNKGFEEVQKRYGETYINNILRNEEFNKYTLGRVREIRNSLVADKVYKENLYKIIKAIENDSSYTSEIVEEEGKDKVKILEERALSFLNKVNKRDNSTIDDLYNTEYVEKSIVAYGGK